jgi:hypothetical protein
MMRYGDPAHLLPWILSNPQRVGRLDRAGWQRLIWQARNADLIGQLEFVLNEAGVLYAAPAAARRHLAVAAQVADKHAQALQWELRQPARGPAAGRCAGDPAQGCRLRRDPAPGRAGASVP